MNTLRIGSLRIGSLRTASFKANQPALTRLPTVPQYRASFLRPYSVDPKTSDHPMDEYELRIFSLLNESFNPEQLQVMDVSGGCGSMFAISIVSDKFKGVPMVKQHRLVNEVLATEIKKWHGLQLVTKAPRK